MSPYDPIKAFEAALCEYTHAPYAVAVSSCTSAIELCLYHLHCLVPDDDTTITLPKRTYVGVAQAVVRQGFRLRFSDKNWSGAYDLDPTLIWDCAKRLTGAMYVPGQFQCVSFHVAKILGDSQGGAILHDNPGWDRWLRKARFDGRTEGVELKDDTDITLGLHCYMSSDVANRLHARLVSHSFPRHNPDQCHDGFLEREYCDLSRLECFKPYVR